MRLPWQVGVAMAAALSAVAMGCKSTRTKALDHCRGAKPGHGQFAFTATTHPPVLRFESTCDARLPLEAGVFHFDERSRTLSGRVRVWNRGSRARTNLVAFVDFLADDRGDKRFTAQVGTLDSVVSARGRRGFWVGDLSARKGRWVRWSIVVPSRGRRVVRGAGWVASANPVGLWIEAEELAAATPEGRSDRAGWGWEHRFDGFSGWGTLTTQRRARTALRHILTVPRPGRYQVSVRVKPAGPRGWLRIGLGPLEREVGRLGHGQLRWQSLGQVELPRTASLSLHDAGDGPSRLDAIRIWPVAIQDAPDRLPVAVLAPRSAIFQLPRYLAHRLAKHPRPAGVAAGPVGLSDWQSRVSGIRAAVRRALDLPKASGRPPGVQHLGSTERGGLRVERLFIEGRPGIWASALVYRPAGAVGRLPAVLHALGHYGPGKHYGPARLFDANLAAQGFVVLAVDALSLGERRTGPENHHFQGLLHWLVGSSAARVLFGEMSAFLSYLQSRSDVDPERIGMVGSSGGGTATLFTAAVDERVRAAAVLAAVTDWGHFFRFTGGDPEQFPFDIVRQADFPTLLRLVAPRPLLVAGGRRDDLFPPRPAREVVAKARDVFRGFGLSERLVYAEDGDPHGLKPGRRLAAYRFFSRWLARQKSEKVAAIKEDPHLSLPAVDAALRTGRPPDRRSLVDAARDRVEGLPPALGTQGGSAAVRAALTSRRRALAKVLSDTPHRGPVAVWQPRNDWVGNSQVTQGTYRVAGLSVPGLLVSPRGPARAVVLYVSDAGKQSGVHAVALAEAGYTVLVADLAGLGELTPHRRYRYGLMRRPEQLYKQDFFGLALMYVLGDSLFALRVAQVRQIAAALRKRFGRPVGVLGQGTECGLYALAAGALDPALAGAAALEPLRSFRREIRRARFPAPGIVAAGILRVADTDQLAALNAPRPVLILGGRASDGQPDPVVPAQDFVGARRIYRVLGAHRALVVRRTARSQQRVVLDWAARLK